jgi:hypothetical protein
LIKSPHLEEELTIPNFVLNRVDTDPIEIYIKETTWNDVTILIEDESAI